MATPHKHAELIKKWADNPSLKIQYKTNEDWHDVGDNPAWYENSEYRIKPETISYRVALLKQKEVQIAYTEELENYLQQSRLFVKWLTDWIEVEI